MIKDNENMSLSNKIKNIKFQNERNIIIKYRMDKKDMWIESRLKDDHHDMYLFWQIDIPSHKVVAIEGGIDNRPFEHCTQALGIVKTIKGLDIGIGVKKSFRHLFKKSEGCTHISELALATFDFIIARLYGPSSKNLSKQEKEKRMRQIANFLCKNDSCVVFNQENLQYFDNAGKFKGKNYSY